METTEEDMQRTFPKQRSLTSPPLLGSVDRSSYLNDGYPLKEKESRQQEIQVTAEIHDIGQGSELSEVPPVEYGQSFKLTYI